MCMQKKCTMFHIFATQFKLIINNNLNLNLNLNLSKWPIRTTTYYRR